MRGAARSPGDEAWAERTGRRRPPVQHCRPATPRWVRQCLPHGGGAGLEAPGAWADGMGRHTCNASITYFRVAEQLMIEGEPFALRVQQGAAYALTKRAVEGDLGEGALENGELLVVQLREK